MSLTDNTDRLNEAQKQFICFLECNPQLEGLLCALIEQIEDLESVNLAMFSALDCDTATGASLEAIGNIVGELKAGRSDTDYRTAIKTKIGVNNSSGTGEEIIVAVQGILGTGSPIQIIEFYPGTLYVYFPSSPTTVPEPSALQAAVQRVTAAGVRSIVWYFTTPTPFGFLSDPTAFGFDTGDLATAF